MNARRYITLLPIMCLLLTGCGLLGSPDGSTEEFSSYIPRGSRSDHSGNASSTNAPTSSSSRPTSSQSKTSGTSKEPSVPTGQVADRITYWCAPSDSQIMDALIQGFKESNPAYANVAIECSNIVDMWAAADQLMADPSVAADVLFFNDEYLDDVARGDLLAPLDGSLVNDFISPDATSACFYNGVQYAYPVSSHNSPIPFYDGTFLSQEDVSSLETILQKSASAGKKVCLDLRNGWYNPCMFWAGGGTLDLQSDGSLKASFDVEQLTGDRTIEAFERFKELYNQYRDTILVSSDSMIVESGFADHSVSYALLWNDYDMLHGQNPYVDCAPWPSVTIGSRFVPLDCFASYKLVACNGSMDPGRRYAAHAFAAFLAGEEAQQLRCEELGECPTNNYLLGYPEAINHPYYRTIAQMIGSGRTHVQGLSTNDYFWNEFALVGAIITNGTDSWGSYRNAKELLRSLLTNLAGQHGI